MSQNVISMFLQMECYGGMHMLPRWSRESGISKDNYKRAKLIKLGRPAFEDATAVMQQNRVDIQQDRRSMFKTADEPQVSPPDDPILEMSYGRAFLPETEIDSLPKLPSSNGARKLVDAAYFYTQARYCIVDWAQLGAWHQQRDELAYVSSRDSVKSQTAAFFIWIVYAIGARLISDPENSTEAYFARAQIYLPAVMSLQDMQSVQALLCLVQYHFRAPSESPMWHLVGLALRLCVKLRYHRKLANAPDSQNLDAYSMELRKRFFWCAYCFDRTRYTGPHAQVPSLAEVQSLLWKLDQWKQQAPQKRDSKPFPQQTPDRVQATYTQAVLLLIRPILMAKEIDADLIGLCVEFAVEACSNAKALSLNPQTPPDRITVYHCFYCATTMMTSYSNPEPKRWSNPAGWGTRHWNDVAPFTLWDEKNRKFRHPSHEELPWIRQQFGEGEVHFSGWLMCIETARPPQPIPLTLGAMSVLFVRSGETVMDLIPRSGYSNPRVHDPCPNVRWLRMTNPTKAQTAAVLAAIAPLAHVRAALFLPFWTIFDLETGDGRSYTRLSLP
ncbi:uncharacterized protein N7511_006920 [Penicillium nucicola]|uniref:uncharacterized protein n=1 Tax=Penicillium nucicola TaxID=1850975 RepID=UPI002545A365|nr:uncharacterized protein N7511_006920 [Penicillium nucicola]KAJ5758226.1 hypothetical protein N7511_006920 [Penicillium nucicola]